MTLYLTNLLAGFALALSLAYLIVQSKGVECFVVYRILPSLVLGGTSILLLYAWGYTLLASLH